MCKIYEIRYSCQMDLFIFIYFISFSKIQKKKLISCVFVRMYAMQIFNFTQTKMYATMCWLYLCIYLGAMILLISFCVSHFTFEWENALWFIYLFACSLALSPLHFAFIEIKALNGNHMRQNFLLRTDFQNEN